MQWHDVDKTSQKSNKVNNLSLICCLCYKVDSLLSNNTVIR